MKLKNKPYKLQMSPQECDTDFLQLQSTQLKVLWYKHLRLNQERACDSLMEILKTTNQELENRGIKKRIK